MHSSKEMNSGKGRRSGSSTSSDLTESHFNEFSSNSENTYSPESSSQSDNSKKDELNFTTKEISVPSPLSLSRRESEKDIVFLSKKQTKNVQKMRHHLEKNYSSTKSFKVSYRTDTYPISGTNCQISLLRNPSTLNLNDDYYQKLKAISDLDNPFLYQDFYKRIDPKEGGSRTNHREPNDLKSAHSDKEMKEKNKENTSTRTQRTTEEVHDTPDLEGSESMSEFSIEDLVDDDIKTGCVRCDSVKGCRWINMLGIMMLSAGLISFVTFSIIKDVVDHHRKPTPLIYEHLSNYIYPQLSGIRTSLVDPDTPEEFRFKTASDGKVWELTFSDEFNQEGRTFYPKDDQFFEAVDIHYLATNDLEWYLPDLIATANGTLNIRMDALKTNNMFYRSGMLQSWNKMCFTQGLVEISARLPGSFESKGFWPGLWSLGNLARPGYMASTEGVWPYTYQSCDAGITPNQSSADGLSQLPGQRLNSCTCINEDHPNRGTGRGAPEFDILEGTFTKEFATVAQTLQIAPFDPWWLPDYDHMAIMNKSTSYMNTYVGTPQQEAISVITTLNETWFEKLKLKEKEHKLKTQRFQTYSMEYRSDQENEHNYISFATGENTTMKISGAMLHPEGNVGWREISKEPMSIVFNLGLSYAWSDIQWMSLEFPATLEIDYIRIYQPKGKKSITCDPYDYPTVDYIEAHQDAYMNANLTSWERAGYKTPKNQLMNDCY